MLQERIGGTGRLPLEAVSAANVEAGVMSRMLAVTAKTHCVGGQDGSIEAFPAERADVQYVTVRPHRLRQRHRHLLQAAMTRAVRAYGESASAGRYRSAASVNVLG